MSPRQRHRSDPELVAAACDAQQPDTVVKDEHTTARLQRDAGVRRASDRYLKAGRSQGKAAPKLLLIDDDLMLRNVTAMVLRHHGYDVITALGPESVDLAAVNDVDLVVTDLLMPGYSGIELIDALTARLPDTAIIAISGGVRGDSGAYLGHARTRGVAATLGKPFRMPALIAKIEEVLAQRCPAD